MILLVIIFAIFLALITWFWYHKLYAYNSKWAKREKQYELNHPLDNFNTGDAG